MAYNPKIQQIIETIEEAGIADRYEVAALIQTLNEWNSAEAMGRTIKFDFPSFVDAIIRREREELAKR